MKENKMTGILGCFLFFEAKIIIAIL